MPFVLAFEAADDDGTLDGVRGDFGFVFDLRPFDDAAAGSRPLVEWLCVPFLPLAEAPRKIGRAKLQKSVHNRVTCTNALIVTMATRKNKTLIVNICFSKMMKIKIDLFSFNCQFLKNKILMRRIHRVINLFDQQKKSLNAHNFTHVHIRQILP